MGVAKLLHGDFLQLAAYTILDGEISEGRERECVGIIDMSLRPSVTTVIAKSPRDSN